MSWLVASEVSVHGQLAPAQNPRGRRAWWRTAAQLLAAREPGRKVGRGQEKPLQGITSDLPPSVRSHLPVSTQLSRD